MYYSKSSNGFYDANIHKTMPIDAVEISYDEYAALREGQARGKIITSDDKGYPILIDPHLPSIEEVKKAALSAIDFEAGKARARYMTVAPGQEATYQLKVEEASAYIAAGRPADTTAYPMLVSEASARGMSVSQLADIIVATRARWVQLAAMIEAQRVSGKLAVEAAASTGNRDAIASARDAVVAELEAM